LQKTANYEFLKPEDNELFDQQAHANANMDAIDAEIKARADAIAAHLAESASETATGHVELATAAETTTGTDNTRAVHPAGLKVELDKKIAKSLLTAVDDIIYASAPGTPAALPKGAIGQAIGVKPDNSIGYIDAGFKLDVGRWTDTTTIITNGQVYQKTITIPFNFKKIRIGLKNTGADTTTFTGLWVFAPSNNTPMYTEGSGVAIPTSFSGIEMGVGTSSPAAIKLTALAIGTNSLILSFTGQIASDTLKVDMFWEAMS